MPNLKLLAVLLLIFCATENLSADASIEHGAHVEHFNSKTKRDMATTVQPGSCGGVIRTYGTEAVDIAYKQMENVLPNERCVWIVAMEIYNENSTSSYRVNTEYIGFSPEDKILSLTGVTRRETNISHYDVPNIGRSIDVIGSIMILTFHTGNDTFSKRGFNLHITRSTSHSLVDYRSTYHIFDVDEFLYPSYTTMPNELSAFTLVPSARDLHGFRNTAIMCKEKYLAEEAWIGVYLFNATSGLYDYSGRLTRSYGMAKIIHNDVILLIYDSVWPYNTGNEFYFMTV